MDILRKYFYGQLSPQEEERVRGWLAEHSDEPEVIRALDEILVEMGAGETTVSKDAYKAAADKLGLRTKRVSKIMKTIGKWTAVVAACIVLPLLGAIGYSHLNSPDVEWHEIVVPSGSTDELILADGSHIYLNAGSRITYPDSFIGKERRIFVEGEVYAKVAKDEEKPFCINANDVNVTVLGTTFNFKAYKNAECVELLLLDGSVQMDIASDARTHKLQVHPGEIIQFDRKSGDIDIKNFDPSRYKPFHEGRAIHFFNLRLSDITEDIERLFGTKVVILDESLAETRYLAWFTNNESIEQILKGINTDGNMKFITKDGVVYISKK